MWWLECESTHLTFFAVLVMYMAPSVLFFFGKGGGGGGGGGGCVIRTSCDLLVQVYIILLNSYFLLALQN